MSEATNNETLKTTTPCRVCGEDIKSGARKCIHCGSWQGPISSRLSLSSDTLAMLVAFGSVLTVGTPPIIDAFHRAFHRDRSDLSFSIQGVSADYISVLISNRGNQPASINVAYLVLAPNFVPPKNDDVRGAFGLEVPPGQNINLVPQGADGAKLIGAGTNQLVRFVSDEFGFSGYWMRVALTKMNMTCGITFLYKNYDGSPVTGELSEECAQFGDFIMAHAVRP